MGISPVRLVQTRHHAVVSVAVAGLLAATVGFSPAASAVAKPKATPGAAPPARTVDVMTRNLYLGASLRSMMNSLGSDTSVEALTEATKAWTTVKNSHPAARMGALAQEIAKARPAVVGLQEVMTWSTYSYDPEQQQVTSGATLKYDFLDLLLKALARRGVTYYEVRGATSRNFTSPRIPLQPGSNGTIAIQFSDRDVILRRAGVTASNAQHGIFTALRSSPQPEPLEPLPVGRGWGSADVRTNGATFRFVNAHVEAFGAEFRDAQVGELFDAQAKIALTRKLPMVYVGDYNSAAPAGAAYKLIHSRLADAWLRANESGGYTCCQAANLANSGSRLSKRIDLVMTSRSVGVKSSHRTGTAPVDLPGSTQWASDHAGVVARLSFK